MLNIEIDGKQLQVADGSTVMDAANQVGVYIPHFCYHKKLSIAANCRMCLVQVEKAPKPLPACATPVTDGMKVQTHSEQAVKAQKGVMEFLLINHPLDCPICDQGGECQLQDLAVGYGGTGSRYQEPKRVVVNKNLGPLISTDMTRCIHCTRCVRFGQEIAGVMELGMAGRGEHSEIMAFVDRTVDSEVSGNVIDLCPVGALTSKPFRYTARTWELSRRKSVSAHDGQGSNLIVQVKNNKVMRVVPLENEEVNECWLSDRDRFAYEGLNSEERLTAPMIKQGGSWQTVDWQVALEYVAHALKDVIAKHGAAAVGALAHPMATLEELYLLQKLVRGLGSANVDARLHQSDFRLDAVQTGAPWLGMPVADINSLNGVLLIGSSIRKEYPLLALRLRQAVKKGCRVSVVHGADDDLLMPIAAKAIVRPSAWVSKLGEIVRAVAAEVGQSLSEKVTAVAGEGDISPDAIAVAANLVAGERKAVFVGNAAGAHPDAAIIHMLAQEIAQLTGATLGVLVDGANTVGAYVAGATPVFTADHQRAGCGVDTKQMVERGLAAYLLLHAEADVDFADSTRALKAMQGAETVIVMSAYRNAAAMDYADVLLPVSPFTETAGTFINIEGRVQSFHGVVKPLGDTRPGWKVLRVLGNLLGLDGFEYDSPEAVRAAVLPNGLVPPEWLSNRVETNGLKPQASDIKGLQRLGEMAMYGVDPIVRRAPALQSTREARLVAAVMNPADLAAVGIKDGDQIRVKTSAGAAELLVKADNRIAAGAIRLPAGQARTSALGAMYSEVSVEQVASGALAGVPA